MRHFLFATALLVAASFCGSARADYPYGYGNNYAPNYGTQVNNYYGGYYANYSRPYGNGYYESYPEAAARIRAQYSRARYFTHPLSLQNGPPVPDYSYGYGYGY